MVEPNKNLGYARDDVFIISVNNSTDRIELVEAELFINPAKLFELYGKISSLYSKTHAYIKSHRKIDERLLNIRKGLYDKDFIRDLKENKIKPETNTHFIKIVDSLNKLYREMTLDYTIGIFPRLEVEDTRPAAVRNTK